MSKLANSLPQNQGPSLQAVEAADPKVEQSRVPESGAWDNGYSDSYAANVEYKEKIKKVESKEPQMSQLMLSPAQPQAHSLPAKPEPPQQEAQLQVPRFSAWESEAIVGYNRFDNLRNLDREERRVGNLARIALLDKDLCTERSRPPAMTNYKQQQQVYGGGRRSTVKHRGSKKGCSERPQFDALVELRKCHNGVLINTARFPLGDPEFITERSLRPAGPDEELANGGGNGLRSVAESESVQKGSILHQIGSCFRWFVRKIKLIFMKR